MNSGMTIGAVAGQTGMTAQAIRFYEREGLVPKPDRTHTGYRLYGPDALARLRFIRTARTLGLSLEEIKQIFRMSRAGQAPCCRVREMLSGKLTTLDRKIAELSRFRSELRALLRKLSQIPDQTDTSRHLCTLIEAAPQLMRLAVEPKKAAIERHRNAAPPSGGKRSGGTTRRKARNRR